MGVVGPTLQSVVSRTGSPSEQGARLGAVSALNSFTGAASPMIGTPLLLAAPGEGLPYLLFSLLLVAALGAAIRHRLPGGHSAH